MGLTKKWRRTSVKTDLFLSTFYLQTKLHAPLSTFFASPSTRKERYLSLGGHLRPWGCISVHAKKLDQAARNLVWGQNVLKKKQFLR